LTWRSCGRAASSLLQAAGGGAPYTSMLDVVEAGMRTSETFYTSVVDAVIWSFCLVGTLALVLVGGDLVADLVKGTLASVRRPSFNVAVWMALAAFGCGLLFFGFGWLGRVTLSPEGMSAPRYSGARDF